MLLLYANLTLILLQKIQMIVWWDISDRCFPSCSNPPIVFCTFFECNTPVVVIFVDHNTWLHSCLVLAQDRTHRSPLTSANSRHNINKVCTVFWKGQNIKKSTMITSHNLNLFAFSRLEETCWRISNDAPYFETHIELHWLQSEV